MTQADVCQRFATLEEHDEIASIDDYNFEHFRTTHLLADARRTMTDRGIAPGEVAPDFGLPEAANHGALRLSDLRGMPVLLHFGSPS